jgi:hypothetical protein
MVDDGYVNDKTTHSSQRTRGEMENTVRLARGAGGRTIINNVLLMALFAFFKCVVSQKWGYVDERHSFGLYGIILELGDEYQETWRGGGVYSRY